MFKLISLSILFSFVLSSHSSASSTFSGQKIYLKECRVCHKSSDIYLDRYTVVQWKKFLNNDGSILSSVHLDKKINYVTSRDQIVKNSHSFFKSKDYKKKYKILKNFIIKHVEHSEKSFYKH